MNNQQKYLTSFCILGAVIAVILAGLSFILRALRKDLPVYDFLNVLAPFSKSDSAAGVAYPLVFSIPFAIFFLYLTCTYKVRDYSINTYNRLMWTTVSLTSVYYVAHIWDHETHQAFVSVYAPHVIASRAIDVGEHVVCSRTRTDLTKSL